MAIAINSLSKENQIRRDQREQGARDDCCHENIRHAVAAVIDAVRINHT